MSFQRTKKIIKKARQRGRKNNNYHAKYSNGKVNSKEYMKYWK